MMMMRTKMMRSMTMMTTKLMITILMTTMMMMMSYVLTTDKHHDSMVWSQHTSLTASYIVHVFSCDFW